jgi:predicted dehydrogenase
MADARLRLALVGCGNIARAHWRGISRLAPRIEVTAVVDPDPARAAAFADRLGVAAFTSIGDALAGAHVEAVDLMVPHDLHEGLALQALAAGRHVLVEKPMAPTLAACERMLAAARAAGRVFMVSEQAQYWPDVHAVKGLLDAGVIGRVLNVRAWFVDRTPVAQPPAPRPWRYEHARAGGGITLDGGAHWLRPLRLWFGEIERVCAVRSRPVAAMDDESQLQGLLRFRSGVTVSFEALLHDGPMAPVEDFRITGSAGEIVVEAGAKGRVLLYDAAHPSGQVFMNTMPGRLDAFGYALRDFGDAVLDGKAPAATAEYSLGELRAALALYRAADAGTWEVP